MPSGKKIYWITNRWPYRLANFNSQWEKRKWFINMLY